MKLSITTLFSLGSLRFSHAALQLTEDCTIVAISDTRIDFDDESYEDTVYSCIGDLRFYSFELPPTEKEHMQKLIDDGDLVINETILLGNNSAVVQDNTIFSLGTLPWNLGRKETQSLRLSDSEGMDKPILPVKVMTETQSLRLSDSEVMDKPILAVKVIDVNGLAHPDNAATIGDNIFGTLGDPVNLKSQMFACSFGQLNITTSYTRDISKHESAPGVIEVDIPISLQTSGRYAIHDAVTAAVQTKLGFNLPGPFEQVMYVLQNCYVDCGWAAYAFVNSWMSVYQGSYYSHAAVQMHEIGHNFGFAHSGGLDRLTYTDHTCIMGNPLYGDDNGKMCYNPAKSWAIGWYDSNKSEVNINTDNINHVETIVGIADFDNNLAKRNVIIKLETDTPYDFFVGFNRAIGVNSQNDEADNEVTIVFTGNNGVGYSQSFLLATLKQGEYWELEDGMIIKAEEIDIISNPGTAKISIKKGAVSPPTAPPVKQSASPISPTNSPIKSPTSNPTMSPVKTNSPIKSPTSNPTTSPVKQSASPTPPTNSPMESPTNNPLDNFVFHPRVDSPGGDIGNSTAGDVQSYAEECNKNAACLGFNSNGWYKNTIKDQSKWRTWTPNVNLGFYVKKGSVTISPTISPPSPPTPPTNSPMESPTNNPLDDFVFHPRVDSPGGDIRKSTAGDVQSYAEECNKNAACLGFNSIGWYKHTIKDQSKWRTWTPNVNLGFYVKK